MLANLQKVLVKLSPLGVNIHQHFTPSFCANILAPKRTNLKCKYKKLLTKLLSEKAAGKMSAKLSPPGVNFINILRAAFSYECFERNFFVLRFEV
jgi:hypothetical protein